MLGLLRDVNIIPLSFTGEGGTQVCGTAVVLIKLSEIRKSNVFF